MLEDYASYMQGWKEQAGRVTPDDIVLLAILGIAIALWLCRAWASARRKRGSSIHGTETVHENDGRNAYRSRMAGETTDPQGADD